MALKTLGLLALMAKAGLFLPVAPQDSAAQVQPCCGAMRSWGQAQSTFCEVMPMCCSKPDNVQHDSPGTCGPKETPHASNAIG